MTTTQTTRRSIRAICRADARGPVDFFDLLNPPARTVLRPKSSGLDVIGNRRPCRDMADVALRAAEIARLMGVRGEPVCQ